MRSLNSCFSHINLDKKKNKLLNKEWSKPHPIDEIRKSSPREVDTYDDLVKDVAQILHRNRNLTLYYRGQDNDYKSDGSTSILPTIYRKKNDEKKLMLKDRFEILNEKSVNLRKSFRNQTIRLAGESMILKYPEIAWSLLQHYESCDTPLIDLTHSLHVACSFANDKNCNKHGIKYIIGLPWQTDAIGYNTYEELVNIRLLSICPPQAQRPYFQEGYLAGPFPNYQLANPRRVNQFDFARRLIAKFKIPVNNPDFWGAGFNKIPHDKLYQPIDTIKTICDQL